MQQQREEQDGFVLVRLSPSKIDNGINNTTIDGATEKTEVIHGAENILDLTLRTFPALKKSVDNCIDSSAPISFVKTEPVWISMIRLQKKE